LQGGEGSAGEGDGAPAGVEAEVDDVVVDEAVEPGDGEDGEGDDLDDAVEDEAVEDVGEVAEPAGEADEGGGVDGVDVPGVVEEPRPRPRKKIAEEVIMTAMTPGSWKPPDSMA
jgi:hypothetical protein